jgi:hypothetical protein
MGMFKPSQPDPAPKAPDPVRLPNQDDPDILAARKRKLQDGIGQAMGRKSTDLTGGASSATQQPYVRSSLG